MWAYVEADFRRDYGIRLTDELLTMSWREFQSLLHGVSPWGAVAMHYEDEAKKQRLEDEADSGKPSNAAMTFWQQIASIGRPE